MMAFLYAGAGTLFTFIFTALGAAMVFCFRKHTLDGRSHLFLSFAAGVMIAASIFSLILPAMEQASALHQPPLLICMAGLVLGTAFMVLLDGPCRRGIGQLHGGTALTYLSITLHNIPEGMAVGLSFALAAGNSALLMGAVTLALGIALQNFPEGAAVSLPLCKVGFSRKKAFLFGTLSGAVEPLFGIFAVLFASRVQFLLPLLMTFSAGAMLYVTFREAIPDAAAEDPSPRPALLIMLGFLIMTCMDVALG